LRLRVLAGVLTFSFAVTPAARAAPWDKPGYTITFHDEFDGTAIDPAQWGKRYKWGEAVINGELQAYVDDAFQLSGGVLSIVAASRQGTYAGMTMSYTSGLIASVHEQTYGYFEMRCRMPKGQGFWPAFWLLGGAGSTGVNEIDIHEFLGSGVSTVYTTLHWGASYNAPAHQSDGKSFTGPDFTADFHTFAVDWDASHVIWYVDSAEVHRHEGVGVPQVNMYIIANFAVGGTWPKAPDATTVFPANYDIDYIRAYQRDADAGVGGDGGAISDASGGSTDAVTGSDVTAADGGVPNEVGAPALSDDAGAQGDAGDGGVEPGITGSKGCSCSTARSERGAWPLALVPAWAVWRRRRR
jgi:beta-glucanase (GH16 family)